MTSLRWTLTTALKDYITQQLQKAFAPIITSPKYNNKYIGISQSGEINWHLSNAVLWCRIGKTQGGQPKSKTSNYYSTKMIRISITETRISINGHHFELTNPNCFHEFEQTLTQTISWLES